jgi:hypothetical protein
MPRRSCQLANKADPTPTDEMNNIFEVSSFMFLSPMVQPSHARSALVVVMG